MRHLAALLVCLHLAGCASTVPAPVKISAAPPPQPVPVVHLHGDGAQLGAEHGRQLGGQINALFGSYFNSWFQNPAQRQLALFVAGVFENRLTPEHKAEVAALAKSVGMDEREIMLAQCFLDASPMTACSTITLSASAAPDGVARFGRNLDFPAFNVADKTSVLLIYHPKDRYAFASVAWPGLIGVLSGMNEHGLTLANMEVDRPQRLPTAMPYTLLYRTILERCRTVDEAVDLLNGTPRQTANNLMLMDAAGDRAVAEITPERVTVRRAPSNAPLTSTNHQRGPDQQTRGRCRRYDTLQSVSRATWGHMDVARMRALLRQVNQGDMTLQSMIFEPASRTLYLAVGARAHEKPMSRIDLAALFARR